MCLVCPSDSGLDRRVAVSSFRGLGSRLFLLLVPGTFHLFFPGLGFPAPAPFLVYIFSPSSTSSGEPFFYPRISCLPFHFEARIKQEQEMDTVMLIMFLSPYKCYHHVHAFRRPIRLLLSPRIS